MATITDTTAAVLNGEAPWGVDLGDAIDWWGALPPDSIDCLVSSPPYL